MAAASNSETCSSSSFAGSSSVLASLASLAFHTPGFGRPPLKPPAVEEHRRPPRAQEVLGPRDGLGSSDERELDQRPSPAAPEWSPPPSPLSLAWPLPSGSLQIRDFANA